MSLSITGFCTVRRSQCAAGKHFGAIVINRCTIIARQPAAQETLPMTEPIPERRLSVRSLPERRLIIRSRMAEDYELSDSSLKNLQHVLTDWLPRSVYFDLTDNTARVDVVVRKSFTGKSAFAVSFITADGAVIKKAEYGEERMLGKVCKPFDPTRTRYDGKNGGFDHRLVIYLPEASS